MIIFTINRVLLERSLAFSSFSLSSFTPRSKQICTFLEPFSCSGDYDVDDGDGDNDDDGDSDDDEIVDGLGICHNE